MPRAASVPARLRTELIAWVVAFRVLLWVLPFRHVLALARRAASWRRPSTPPLASRELEGVLGQASRYVPRASCLPRALAAGVFLARAGEPVALVLGCPDHAPRAQLEAHAWLERPGDDPVGALPGQVELARLALRSN